MRKSKIDEEELFKEINIMCLDCTKDCKQSKKMKICRCPAYNKKEQNEI